MNDQMKYILAIDGGTQSTKLSIFSVDGELVCEASAKMRDMVLGPNGLVEHPDDDLWDSLVTACQRLWDTFEGDRSDIIGVGLCTIRFCRALLKTDASLAQPVMSWMDERVSRPHETDNPDVAFVTTSSGYITARLTGKLVDTAANYEGQWPLDHLAWDWSKEPSDWSNHPGLKRDNLFDLIMPGQSAGLVSPQASRQTGIPQIPVIVTANDKAVEALGSGLIDPGTVLVSLGTYIASMRIGSQYEASPTNYWTNAACIPHRYLYESTGIRRGMWTISWLINLLGSEFKTAAEHQGIVPEQLLEREARGIGAGSDGVLAVLDFLAPTDEPHIKGSLLGLDARTDRAHIYKSIIEGIAMTMNRHMVAMNDELGEPVTNLVLSGGGANSDLMTQVFSDVTGLPVHRNSVNSSVSIGSAICVAVALGFAKDFESGISMFVKPKDVTQPNESNHAVYAQLEEKAYRHAREKTSDIYRATYQLFG